MFHVSTLIVRFAHLVLVRLRPYKLWFKPGTLIWSNEIIALKNSEEEIRINREAYQLSN